ncbi:N-lysine methyltransferase KMT5A-A-like [Neoarius graeffei]|uniref:N-lysine methyltransferase KMT5A-A-like n=1 Tax=Neoarius graeffei TaxID=443677 RepID=UPI00298C5F90|nr:N-lysine methyltransferase KMT5A-A-like [Neoarius graeffei]
MKRRRRINPKEDAKFYVRNGRDKVGLDVKYINAFKGRGIFTTTPFAKSGFLLEYQGELISKQTSERRRRIYHDCLKVFMFEFQFNGTLWCVDLASEDGSLGRLVNDDHINPNAKMKYLRVEGKPHLCLFAIRDTSPGEEITYNYRDSDWPWRCKKPGGMSTEGQHGEVPHTSELSRSAQKVSASRQQKKASTGASAGCLKGFDRGLDEEMPQQGSETTNSPSKAEVLEMTAEGEPDSDG